MIKPMLCEELEVDGVVKQFGLDGDAATAAYRKAITEQLKDYMARGFVSERKGWAQNRL